MPKTDIREKLAKMYKCTPDRVFAFGFRTRRVFFAAFIALSVFTSLALHFAVEKPFLQLKSRLF